MRKIRDILRLRLSAGLSIRAINASTKVSVGAIQKLLTQAKALELDWPLPAELDDSQLARLFYPEADTRVSSRYQAPDWASIHQELKRKGMTKQLLWEEYTRQYPNRCYSYSQFCDRYNHWRGLQKRSMRQSHRAGEKCFVDYCGQTVPIICADTGEFRTAQVFVAVLGASNYDNRKMERGWRASRAATASPRMQPRPGPAAWSAAALLCAASNRPGLTLQLSLHMSLKRISVWIGM